jgi:hypothetical protein
MKIMQNLRSGGLLQSLNARERKNPTAFLNYYTKNANFGERDHGKE